MRIVWSKDEKATIERALIDIFAINPERGFENALRDAQEKLPMARRQKITAQRVFSHKPMLIRAREAGVVLRNTRAQKMATPPEPPTVDPHSVGTLFELLVDRIVDAVYAKVTTRLKAEYGQEAERQFDAEYAKHNAKMRQGMADAGSLVQRNPTALVIGLLPQQANIVRPIFADDPIELRFFDSEMAKASRQWPKVDRIYLMTKWVSHSVQSKVQATHTPYTLVNGNVSELTRIIRCHLDHGAGSPLC